LRETNKEITDMSELIKARVSAEIDEDIVVFLIGMRINKLWKIWKWLPIMGTMPKMLAELAANPELGMLAARGQFGLRNFSSVQYWKSAAHLQAFARSADKSHLPAWTAFYRSAGSKGDIGIWHETYVVPRGNLETIYLNMPRFGLGLVGKLFPATGSRANAARRLSRNDQPTAA
jgi:hypothetical protein